jgi:hypothetical protein
MPVRLAFVVDRLVLAVLAAGLCAVQAHARGDDPFADEVISYEQGVGGAPMYNTPASSLGEPARVSGACFSANDIVTAFSPPYCPNEIVSIGAGGHLTVRFDTPVTDDPNNLYGIDLLIFGNAFFIDGDWPNGVIAGLFSEGGEIAVSADGTTWFDITEIDAGIWPTVAYNDAPAYTSIPGKFPSNFTRPVDPALTLDDMIGLDNQAMLELYRGSGGGAGIDLAWVGVPALSYVRVSLPSGARGSPKIDGFADVMPRRAGDVDLDGDTDADDLVAVILNWGPQLPGTPPADFDNDGDVDADDLVTVILNWSNG